MKVNTPEANTFQEWILKQSTLTKSIIKWIIKIKHQQELEQKTLELDKCKKELELTKTSEKELMELSLNAVKLFPQPAREAGTIYIATSPDYQKKYTYKIGLTTVNAKSRESSMQTSNPDINIVFTIDALDARLTETYIHEYLKHVNYDKEFFYISSLDKAKEIVTPRHLSRSNADVFIENISVTHITNFVNECINKFDGDNGQLQKQYIDDSKNKTLVALKQPPQIRGRSKSPSKNAPVLRITEKDVYKQYLEERTKTSDKHIHTSMLYDNFKTWFVSNNPKTKIPSTIVYFYVNLNKHTLIYYHI